jgi:hypothetical protein
MRRSCVISCDVHDSRFAYFAHRKVRRVPRTQGNLVRVIGNSSRAVFCYECLCFPTRFAKVLGRLALYHDGVARSRTVCCSANPTAEVGRVMSLMCLELIGLPTQGLGSALLIAVPATMVGVVVGAIIEWCVVRYIQRTRLEGKA